MEHPKNVFAVGTSVESIFVLDNGDVTLIECLDCWRDRASIIGQQVANDGDLRR
jgi:hypothetical protein